MLNIINTVVKKTSEDLNKVFDEIIIEGLRRKGFTFNSREDAERFIKQFCRCEQYSESRLFFVKDEPFLRCPVDHLDITLHGHSIEVNFKEFSYL